MTLKDTKGILALLQSEYPQSFSRMDVPTMRAKANLWAEMFADDDPHLVLAAVKALLVEGREFAPSLGQVKEKMRQLTEPDALTETEAWALVAKACANGLYGYQKEFEALPPEVQAAVGSANQLREWAMMDSDVVQSVVASNFMRSYRVGVQRAKDRAALPESVKVLLDGMAKKMALPALERGKEIDDEA